jgi:endogenous inhibitor of DNA gyrase (YacG/DUF329 family)
MPMNVPTDYSRQWEELRLLRGRAFTFAAGTLAAAALALVCPKILKRETVCVVLILLGMAAALGLLWIGRQYSDWPCPRCGKTFHFKEVFLGRFFNPFASRCMHCHLPKWANYDPDGKDPRAYLGDRPLGLS